MKFFLMFLFAITPVFKINAAEIKQLLNDQSLAVVELSTDEKSTMVGDSFLASNETSQCILKILSIDGRNATASTSDCNDKSALKVGKKIEKSLFAKEALEKPSIPEKPLAPTTDNVPAFKPEPMTSERNYLGFSIGYMVTPKLKIDVFATNGSSSESGYFEYQFSNTLRLGFEWSQFMRDSWNNGFSVEYANPQFDSFTVFGTVSGSTSGTLSGGMTLFSLGYAGKYRWDRIYLPTLIGITSSSVDSSGIFTKTLATRVLAGLGIGFLINDSFAIEFSSNSNTVAGSSVLTGGTTFTPESGNLNYWLINAKFRF